MHAARLSFLSDDGAFVALTYDNKSKTLELFCEHDEVKTTLFRGKLEAIPRKTIEVDACSLKTPALWCDALGVEVIDPDGWDRTSATDFARPIFLNTFLEKFRHSTTRIVDRTKYQRARHLF